MTDLLTVVNLSKRFGGVLATDNLCINVRDNEIHALIGPNGAGKTTALSQIAGELISDGGDVVFAGRNINQVDAAGRARIGIVRTFQIPRLLPDETALENVAIAVQVKQGGNFRLFDNACADRSRLEPAMVILSKLDLEAIAHTRASNLSHGEQKLLELAIALSLNPKILLLDEPMAGIGPTEAARFKPILMDLKRYCGILLVEHDMEAVFSLSDRITVLVYGRAIVTGTVEEIRKHPDVISAYLGEESF